MKQNFDRPHYVDEDTETVYLSASSWGGAVSSRTGSEIFQDTSCVILSKESLQKKIKGDNEDA